jgi:SAM-dependent methyltransferase
VTPCKGCGAPGTEPVIDLGRQPLANAYLDDGALHGTEPEPMYPLALVFCERCALVQIAETVDPAVLFGDYRYLSSSSDAFVSHARSLVTDLVQRYGLDGASHVYEIGSNDGYLLQHYQAFGIPVLGIEPAEAIARMAGERGVPTLDAFFTAELARSIRARGLAADVIHANNVLAHMPDVHDALDGIATLLADGGTFVAETPYVRDLVDRLEFDTIYHEHVFAYSLSSLQSLFGAHGLDVVGVERLPVHGGSLRVFAQKAPAVAAPIVGALAVDEQAAGLLDAAYYRTFASRVEHLGDQLRDTLLTLRKNGRRVAGYGAAAKGTVLLNAFAIGTDLVEFVVDRNPLKQGRYMPGQHQPIRPPEALLAEMPDVVLLLAWNVEAEVVAQQQEYLRAGGRFLVPVPEPRFVSAGTS